MRGFFLPLPTVFEWAGVPRGKAGQFIWIAEQLGGVEDIVHLVGEVEEDVGVNGQARGLHDRKAIRRRGGAVVAAARW